MQHKSDINHVHHLLTFSRARFIQPKNYQADKLLWPHDLDAHVHTPHYIEAPTELWSIQTRPKRERDMESWADSAQNSACASHNTRSKLCLVISQANLTIHIFSSAKRVKLWADWPNQCGDELEHHDSTKLQVYMRNSVMLRNYSFNFFFFFFE